MHGTRLWKHCITIYAGWYGSVFASILINEADVPFFTTLQESEVMASSKNMHLTRALHVIRAHHLHYTSLLEDFRKSVEFIYKTPNPAMDSDTFTEYDRLYSRKLLEKECNNLMIEIDRLEAMRSMQDKRLKNVMNLVFSTVNIGDSKKMQELTEAAVRDSAGMLFSVPLFSNEQMLTMILI
jgi:hypothetical protein